jgi:hypothetical protein
MGRPLARHIAPTGEYRQHREALGRAAYKRVEPRVCAMVEVATPEQQHRRLFAQVADCRTDRTRRSPRRLLIPPELKHHYNLKLTNLWLLAKQSQFCLLVTMASEILTFVDAGSQSG